MIDYDECVAVCVIITGKGNRSTRRKPLSPTQISNDLTWARTRAATVGSRRLTYSAIGWANTVVDLTRVERERERERKREREREKEKKKECACVCVFVRERTWTGLVWLRTGTSGGFL
jgi:hypothetical protein